MQTSDSTADVPTRAKGAREALDAHVREIVAWHFDLATGCPFWLEKAKTFGWDPRKFSGWDALIVGTQEHIPNVEREYGKYFRNI